MTADAPTSHRAWPRLRVDDWAETRDTLHMWTQIVGKVRLSQSPMLNHWWQVTRPRTVGQVPLVYSHTRSHEPGNQGRRYWDEDSAPLFPFGHGLSYGSFDYSDIGVDQDSVASDATVTVSARVTNASDREATEVVQLYLHQRYGSASRPVRELKGFQRITLPGGASQQVQFTLGPEQRRYWSITTRDWVLDDTVFDVWVGTDSTAQLTATFSQSARPGR